MAFDYAALNVDTVQPLIDEFGDDGELSVNVPGTGAPYESDLDEPPILHPIRQVRSVFKKMDNNGTLVEKNDVLFLVSTKGVTIDPALADRMIVDSVSYQVVRIDPLKPGPVVMLWKIHVRK